MADPSSPLLDAEFLRLLEVLRRRLDLAARSGAAGDHLAKRRGGSAEFQEHRAYEPGDDLRRVDWLAYARTGEPVIKLYRAEEDYVIRLVLDASRSLSHGDPPKLAVAKRLAAAVGYMALAGSERAQLIIADEGVRRQLSPVRGRGGVPTLFRSIEGVEPNAGTDLTRAIDRVVQGSSRPGMLAVFSDFFDPGPVVAAMKRAAAAGHQVCLVQILTPDEIHPDFEGDFALEDLETGALVEVTMDVAAIDAYRRRFEGLCEELRSFARRHRGSYIRARTDEPLESVVRRFTKQSID